MSTRRANYGGGNQQLSVYDAFMMPAAQQVENYPRMIPQGDWRFKQPMGRQSPSRVDRNSTRRDSHRQKKGSDVLKQISQAMDKKLTVGLKEAEDALGLIEARNTLKAVTVFITTRGIGFSVANLYMVARNERHNHNCVNIYAYFRVSLALIENRMAHNLEAVDIPHRNVVNKKMPQLTYEQEHILRRITFYPASIARILNIVGVLKDRDEVFAPSLSLDYYRHNLLVPRSENLILSNLRANVEALANPDVPLEERQNFRWNCAIPGAIWHNDLLMNPDEIMPPVYPDQQFAADVAAFISMGTWLRDHRPKLFSDTILNWRERGNKAIFLSNAQQRMHISPRLEGEPLPDYYRRMTIEGNIDAYWSRREVKTPDLFSGQLSLVGELPVAERDKYPDHVFRTSKSGWAYSSDYKGVQRILNG